SGWQALGTWTATNAITLPPANVSVTPSSGAGSSQTFSFVFSDVYGFADINWVQMHFQTSLVANNACYVQYTRANNNVQLLNVSVSPASGAGLTQTFAFVYSDPYGFADISWTQMHFGAQLQANAVCYMQYTRSTNTVQLFNNAGSGYVGSGGTLGAAGTLSNSQCTINLATSSTSGSGNNLTVNLAITFTGAFAGAKTTSMGVINNAGVFSGWQSKGVWTVQ